MTAHTLAQTETLRNAELPSLLSLLKKQADLRYDVVVPASALSYEDGLVKVKNGTVRFDDLASDFVEADAVMRPTLGCEGQFAERLGIPPRYIRTMRNDAIETAKADDEAVDATGLLDHNINHWLAKQGDKRYLLRGFRTDDVDDIGIARALLSDRFGVMDNLDVLMAALKGVSEAGLNVNISGADLSERKMNVRIEAPEINALAPGLLRGYRSPFNGGTLTRAGGVEPDTTPDLPIVWAGLVIGNSETGDGAFSITPRLVVQICRNGMTIKKDAMRDAHLGGRLDEGVINWSQDTARKAADLVTAKARDAVTTFLSTDYIEKVVGGIEAQADTQVGPKVVEHVTKQFGFSEAEQETILAAFVSGGQMTAGGVMQAVTAAAQTCQDAERAETLEASALDVLEFAAAN